MMLSMLLTTGSKIQLRAVVVVVVVMNIYVRYDTVRYYTTVVPVHYTTAMYCYYTILLELYFSVLLLQTV